MLLSSLSSAQGDFETHGENFDLPSETHPREMVCCKVFRGVASCTTDLHKDLLGFGVMNDLMQGKLYVQPWALFSILGP